MARQQKQKSQTRVVPKYKGAEAETKERMPKFVPRNTNQRLYYEAIQNYRIAVATGYSGTAKTYIPVVYAARRMLEARLKGETFNVVITRPTVSVDEGLGFFKGSLDDKMEPWAAAVIDIFREILGDAMVDIALKNGQIRVAPLSTMRGATLKNALVILDEAQNLTVAQLKMFLTRQGENSKFVINGDIKQTDLKKGSGLATLLNLIDKYGMVIPVVEFGVDDIERSAECKEWIIAFDKEGI